MLCMCVGVKCDDESVAYYGNGFHEVIYSLKDIGITFIPLVMQSSLIETD